MLIALLAVLGVDLIVLVAFLLLVLWRRRWVSHQSGSFAGIAQVVDGEVPGLGHRARRGYGRWVRDVLVWTPGSLCLRNVLVPVDAVDGSPVAADSAKRLGNHPQSVSVVGDGARLRITVRASDASTVTHQLASASEVEKTPK